MAILKIAFDIWINVSSDFAYVFIPVVPFLVYEFIGEIPGLNFVLKIIGKNATNIFLIHTFIYYYWYTDIVYSIKEDWCIVLTITVISVVLSQIIELLKKVSGYNKLMKKTLTGIERVWQ